MPSGIYIRKNKKTIKERILSRKKVWKNYYLKNRKRLLERNLKRRLGNPEYYKKYEKDRYAKNPEFYKNKWRLYSKTHREKINLVRRKRYAEDMNYKLKCIIRARLISTIKQNQKKGSILKSLGCTIPELRIYIEKLFKPGMSWSNWSYKGWHIDHIRPLSVFNSKDILQACHYTNLQPMWSIENHKKGNRI